MVEYELEEFSGALKSCMNEGLFFIHVDGDLYHAIRPRTPFIFIDSHYQSIPKAMYLNDSGEAEFEDFIILTILVLMVILGSLFAVSKREIIGCYSRCSGGARLRSISDDDAEGAMSPKHKSMLRLWSSSLEWGHERVFSPYFFRSARAAQLYSRVEGVDEDECEEGGGDGWEDDDVSGQSGVMLLPLRTRNEADRNLGTLTRAKNDGEEDAVSENYTEENNFSNGAALGQNGGLALLHPTAAARESDVTGTVLSTDSIAQSLPDTGTAQRTSSNNSMSSNRILNHGSIKDSGGTRSTRDVPHVNNARQRSDQGQGQWQHRQQQPVDIDDDSLVMEV